MRRREFVALVGSAAAAWPRAARAQQAALPVIGFLGPGSAGPMLFERPRSGRELTESGYVDGQNVTIDFRWAEDHLDRLPAMATDLVHRQVAVIATSSTPAALAAKAATNTIPMVFETAADPSNSVSSPALADRVATSRA